MNEIIKAFRHIARDILIYIFPGLTLIFFFLFIGIEFYGFISWDKCLNLKSSIFMTFAAYIAGHITFGLMELLFVKIPIETIIKKKIFGKDYKELLKNTKDLNDAELEILAFSNRDVYEFFVERHTQLSLFRWNMSGSFFIISIISFVLRFFINDCFLY